MPDTSLLRQGRGRRLKNSARPPGKTSPHFYRSREVVEILGISRRQLQYWARTGLVPPAAKTPGGHHRYSFEDLVALKAAKRLIDAGVSVQRIRKSIDALRSVLPTLQRPLAELVLVATGDIVLVFREGTAFEAVSGQDWILEVAQFQRELDALDRRTGLMSRRGTAKRKSAGRRVGST